jgi:hypothetical protein
MAEPKVTLVVFGADNVQHDLFYVSPERLDVLRAFAELPEDVYRVCIVSMAVASISFRLSHVDGVDAFNRLAANIGAYQRAPR